MIKYQFTWKGKLLAVVLTILGLLFLVTSASTRATMAESVLTEMIEAREIETETPRIWPHLEMSATIMPAPMVGRVATVSIEVISDTDEEQVTIFTQMSPEIELVSGNTTRVGSVQANEPLIHEFTMIVREPGQWAIYVSAAAISGAQDDEKLHITSMANVAEVIPSIEYQVFQSKEEWPGDPAELIPHQFPQHPEPVVVSPEYVGGDP